MQTNDTVIKTVSFQVNRGLTQGDIMLLSSLFFILVFELILKHHDNVTDKEVNFGGEIVCTLGHVHDVTLLDEETVD